MLSDSLRVWGQTTLVYQAEDPEKFDPAEVLASIQRQAAEAHCVDAADVRVRALNRLS